MQALNTFSFFALLNTYIIQYVQPSREHMLIEARLLKDGKTCFLPNLQLASVGESVSTVESDSCLWMRGVNPDMAFSCCSPSTSRLDMLYFSALQLYRVVICVTLDFLSAQTKIGHALREWGMAYPLSPLDHADTNQSWTSASSCMQWVDSVFLKVRYIPPPPTLHEWAKMWWAGFTCFIGSTW